METTTHRTLGRGRPRVRLVEQSRGDAGGGDGIGTTRLTDKVQAARATIPSHTETVFLTVGEASRLLRLSPITLARWRIAGVGPPFRKFGRRVVYAAVDVTAWADGQTHHSTSELDE